MRRWNGWGDDATLYPLPDSAARFLEAQVGKGATQPDVSIEKVIASIPVSRLPAHPLITIDPLERLRHARGQSLPDWIELRSGCISSFPDGVAYPSSEEEVRSLLDYAKDTGTCVIPYGGGTSVVGHINPLSTELPSLTVDLSRLNRLLDLDEISRLATFEAGVNGPSIEVQLNSHGYTLGHFPQSFELSTLGGWIATRSSGQQSYHYGRIENLFAGGHLETLRGPLDLPCLPASAAGPDLRQVILGSEGRLGILTKAVVRVQAIPEIDAFYGIFFRDWESGVEAVREIVQARLQVSMMRLSNAVETETTLQLSGKDQLVRWARRGLGWIRYGPENSILVFGVTGSRSATGFTWRKVTSIARSHGGLYTGSMIGKMWQKSRFYTPYLRNTLWEQGYTLDTVETAVPWVSVFPTAAAITDGISNALTACGVPEREAHVLVFAHLSHIYPDGASIYTTFLFQRAKDPEETLFRWQALKQAASQAILAHRGTISHQHGVGRDHAVYLPAEKGPLGMALLGAACKELDPQGLMNPGKLLAI